MNEKRVKWIDVSRGILILLMVIGHATGIFNSYIYQFHIAAFFFISGYASASSKKNIFKFIYDRFCTLILPLISSMLVGLTILWILHLKELDTVFSSYLFPGWKIALESFFTRGDTYVDVLGANWFLGVLFGVCIINKFVLSCISKKFNFCYLIISFFLYILGYYYIGKSLYPHIGFLLLDLIYVGQFFYAVGGICRQYKIAERVEQNEKIALGLILITLVIMWCIGKYWERTVDWPPRKFNSPFGDILLAFNGIVLIVATSILICKCCKRISNMLVYAGENSIGILLLHFSCFKVFFCAFYLFGLIERKDLACLVPSRMSNENIEKQFGLLIAIGAVGLSLFIYKLLMKSRVARFLLGRDKKGYDYLWSKIKEIKVCTFFYKKSKLLKKRLYEVTDTIKIDLRKNRYLIIAVMIIIGLAIIPMINQGVMCNDELQARFWSMKGFKDFYKHYWQDHVDKGRALSTPIVSFTMYVGFIAKSSWVFRTIQVSTVLLDAGLFAILLYYIFKSKAFSAICALSFVVFLPITFEHTAPNAFNTLYNIPVAMLLVSLILFISYLSDEKKSKLLWSMGLLLVVLCSYEAFITYIPLYIALVIYKKGFKEKKELLRNCIPPFVAAFIFLVCYLLSRRLFESKYTGNQIGGFTFKSMFEIIAQLVQASFPGYYVFSDKYQYLTKLYVDQLSLENVIRAVCVCGVFGIFLYLQLKRVIFTRVKTSGIQFFSVLGVGIMCIVFPTLPIAVSKMYQNNVNQNGFMALPLTYFCYFASTFVCWYVISNICKIWAKKEVLIILSVGVVCYLAPVQFMNDIFSIEQRSNFSELEDIEELFHADIFKAFEGRILAGADLYYTQNALAIHEGYWDRIAELNKVNLSIKNIEGTGENQSIFLVDGNLNIWVENHLCVISKMSKDGYGLCKYAKNDYRVINYLEGVSDNSTYVYFFMATEDGKMVSSDQETFKRQLIGSTLQDSVKVKGYYEDGWVEKESSFTIRSQEEGLIEMVFFYPYEDFDGKEVSIYVNDNLEETVNMNAQNISVSLQVKTNEIINIDIKTNFQIEAEQDIRELALILVSMEGK